MNKELVAEQSIEIESRPKQVWEALTDPEKIKVYLFGTNTTSLWNTGSPILFEGNYNGTVYKDKGIVTQHEKYSLLSYSYWSGFSGLEDKPENYSQVTYRIESISDNLVKFTWNQQGFSSEEGKCHTEEGLKSMLAQIKKVVEDSK